MTQTEAIDTAIRRARRLGEDVWVVREAGEWDTATLEDLDTFYAGIRDENVYGPYRPDW